MLALDLATNTGWALHKPGMERPHFGTWRLPGTARDVGVRLEALRLKLNELRQIYGDFSHVVFEAQHVPARRFNRATGKMMGGMDMDTLSCLIGLGAMVEWYSRRIWALCYKVPIGSWRKHFLGRGGSFTDRGQKISAKELAVRKCRDHGWFTDSHDAAEACGILDYFLTMIEGYDRPWRDLALLGGINGRAAP